MRPDTSVFEADETLWLHRSVMVGQVAEFLVAQSGGGGCYIDATIGSGGHAAAVLERAGAGARLLGIDRDPLALARAGARLEVHAAALSLMHGAFGDLAVLVAAAGWPAADGIVMDLGVSSDQLEDPERGFSFMQDGPLDMRMDPHGDVTASDLIGQLDEMGLCELFRKYGEEPAARRVARRIVRERQREPITRTLRLAAVIAAAKGGGFHGGRHPATRCFQALRIAVNRELDQLTVGLEAALELLRPGGRLAVIAFHSLEDRCVKACFRRHAGRETALAAGGSRMDFQPPRTRILTRRPLVPDASETACNPRARSAKLRVAQREVDGDEKNTTSG